MDKEYHHRQLVRLGDMMGDGLHLEPDGKWIVREYKTHMKSLGLLPKRKNNTPMINELMASRVSDVVCGNCSGELKQNRSGSKRATCLECKSQWKLLK